MMALMMVVVIDGNDRKKDLCTILLGGTRARLGLVEDARLINNKSLGQQLFITRTTTIIYLSQ